MDTYPGSSGEDRSPPGGRAWSAGTDTILCDDTVGSTDCHSTRGFLHGPVGITAPIRHDTVGSVSRRGGRLPGGGELGAAKKWDDRRARACGVGGTDHSFRAWEQVGVRL